jgi:hypothetical protein
MSGHELGPWEPLGVEATVDTFRAAPFRWWISGGHALELHLGRSWRNHGDMDVGILGRDAAALRSTLDGWDIQVAAAGRLTPWAGGELVAALHQNNLWCRRHVDGPWLLDVQIGAGDDEAWTYRRDPRLRLPWFDAVLHTTDGVPYLAPALQLFFKAKHLRAKDDLDARVMIPELDAVQRGKLTGLLPSEHPWQRLLEGPHGA